MLNKKGDDRTVSETRLTGSFNGIGKLHPCDIKTNSLYGIQSLRPEALQPQSPNGSPQSQNNNIPNVSSPNNLQPNQPSQSKK